MEGVKRLPYGISSFEDLRSKNSYFVDKSMYIPKLEDAGDFLLLIRPRRFGKSIFLSMLKDYYDMSRQDQFDELFGGMWIHEHPTAEKGKYQVIHFDFSKASAGGGSLEENFHRYCSTVVCAFAMRYEKYYFEGFYQNVKERGSNSADMLNYIYDMAQMKGYRLYLIIDEYDNFTNNVLNEQGQAVYHALTHATGFYRDEFKIYKANFSRILMMGVSPVTMDDLTSGFNISRNISMHPFFNMMLGFSETEVRQMIEYYRNAGMITAPADELVNDMKPWYDNYCFAEESLGTDPKMFNCDMVVYYLMNYIDKGCPPKNMIDTNTRTDYKKMKRLIEIEGVGENQRGIIRRIATEGEIKETPRESFPAERIYNKENFVSLLYYYGMLTMKDYKQGRLTLGIPNNNVRKQYYEYLLEEYQHASSIDMMQLSDNYWRMAYEGEWRDALQTVADAYRNNSSVRSAIEGERNIQGFFTAYLSLCHYYLTAPEVELNHGFCDLFLLPDLTRYPDMAHSYIIELKYLSANATEAEAERQWAEAIIQINSYADSLRLRAMCGNTQLHKVILQLRQYELVRMEEV